MDPYVVTSMIAETTILWKPWTVSVGRRSGCGSQPSPFDAFDWLMMDGSWWLVFLTWFLFLIYALWSCFRYIILLLVERVKLESSSLPPFLCFVIIQNKIIFFYASVFSPPFFVYATFLLYRYLFSRCFKECLGNE